MTPGMAQRSVLLGFMNLPNKITIFRIFLVPVLMVLLLVPMITYRFFFALFVFVIAAWTDHLDGRLARKLDLVTDFGKFLDPLADKMLVMSAFICFVDLKLVSAVPVIIILLREFLVTSLRLVAMNSGQVIAANIFGKAKTVSQIIAITVILVSQCAEQVGFTLIYSGCNLFTIINVFFVWVAVGFTVLSGYIYIKENFNVIKN